MSRNGQVSNLETPLVDRRERRSSLSSATSDIPQSSQIRISISKPVSFDISTLVSSLSQFGEIQHLDISRKQFDSTISVSYFDIRASAIARKSIENGSCAGLSIAKPESETESLFITTSAARSVAVFGFHVGATNCQEILLSVFGKYGEVESMVHDGGSKFIVSFFDSRSRLSVMSALKATHDQRTISTEQFFSLLVKGASSCSDESSEIRSPPSRKRTINEFSMNLRQIENGSNTNTTIMLRNIPKTFSQDLLVSVVGLKFLPAKDFDFIYLPMDLMNGVNVGYAFMNFPSPLTIIKFYNFFNNKSWKVILQILEFPGARAFESTGCGNNAKVTYARMQGMEQLRTHFQSSSIMHQPDSIRPVFYANLPN